VNLDGVGDRQESETRTTGKPQSREGKGIRYKTKFAQERRKGTSSLSRAEDSPYSFIPSDNLLEVQERKEVIYHQGKHGWREGGGGVGKKKGVSWGCGVRYLKERLAGLRTFDSIKRGGCSRRVAGPGRGGQVRVKEGWHGEKRSRKMERRMSWWASVISMRGKGDRELIYFQKGTRGGGGIGEKSEGMQKERNLIRAILVCRADKA